MAKRSSLVRAPGPTSVGVLARQTESRESGDDAERWELCLNDAAHQLHPRLHMSHGSCNAGVVGPATQGFATPLAETKCGVANHCMMCRVCPSTCKHPRSLNNQLKRVRKAYKFAQRPATGMSSASNTRMSCNVSELASRIIATCNNKLSRTTSRKASAALPSALPLR